MTELHEILELYCELLLARSQLLETNLNTPSFASSISNATASALASRKSNSAVSPAAAKNPPDTLAMTQDLGLDEAIRSIIFAAPRTDIKELMQVRQLLLEKFGKEVGQQAMEGIGVAERVLKKLKVETPATNLVDAYLREIARTYGLEWPTNAENDNEGDDESSSDSTDDNDKPDSGQRVLLGERGLEKEKPEKHLEQALTTDVKSTTESTVAAPAASAVTQSTSTSKIAEDGQDKEEHLLIRSASSPPIGDITDHTPSTLQINPPSPTTENAQPRIKFPGLPEGKSSREKTKKKRRAKREGAKYAKTTDESVVQDVEDKSSQAKVDEISMGIVHDKSEKAIVGKGKKNKGGIEGFGGVSGDSGRGGKIPDVDELARRFAELKR